MPKLTPTPTRTPPPPTTRWKSTSRRPSATASPRRSLAGRAVWRLEDRGRRQAARPRALGDRRRRLRRHLRPNVWQREWSEPRDHRADQGDHAQRGAADAVVLEVRGRRARGGRPGPGESPATEQDCPGPAPPIPPTTAPHSFGVRRLTPRWPFVDEGPFAAGISAPTCGGWCWAWAGRSAATSSGRTERLTARVIDVTDRRHVVVRLESGEVSGFATSGSISTKSTSRPVECFGRRAAAANRRLVGGRVVSLEPGVERRDDYGRLLAYVRRGGVLVNAELVRRGPRPIAHDRAQRRPGRAVREARAGRRTHGNGVVGPLLI